MTKKTAKKRHANNRLSQSGAAGTSFNKTGRRAINLALQGGGAHGAFTWGVLDQLLADERTVIEAITATSAGAVNAVVLAYGLLKGREHAQSLLKQFWRKVSVAGSMTPLGGTMLDKVVGASGISPDYAPTHMFLDYMTRMFSPYQLNVFDLNPLRNILNEMVDFEELRKKSPIKLFINATNVKTGKIRVFESKELTLEMVMASACLPFLYRTVEVDGEPYWDGGYSGNPAIYPLFYKTACQDVVLVQVNPLTIAEAPKSATEILDRVNEISFNATLIREMRAIVFVQDLLRQGKIPSGRYMDVRVHMIEAQEIMASLGSASKLNPDWDFLVHLHETGVQSGREWLENHFDDVGKKSSIDIRKVFL